MKKLYELWCALTHKCPKCGEHLACNDNQFAYGNWYCPNCDGNCEEIGISERLSKHSVYGSQAEDLEKAAEEYDGTMYLSDAFIAGANWQKEQMMKDATKIEVKIDAGGYPYIPQIELYDYGKDIPLAKKGDKVKIIIMTK